MELIIVIIIMGVMSLGIAGFINLSTQTYLNVTERDELLANARFAVERLTREISSAVPNSVRTNGQCLEFVPIVASTIYTDIAIAPQVSNTLTVIPFIMNAGNIYQCTNACGDLLSVYPINATGRDIYDQNAGKVFAINNYVAPLIPTPPAIQNIPATITLTAAVGFAEDSPTNRVYIFNTPVSYCLRGETLTRYVNYDFTAAQGVPPFNSSNGDGSSSLMAEQLNAANSGFTVLGASLQRNAVVQIQLNFTRDNGDEQIVFDNAIHINNLP
jgi:MSHA biogenesis protein MshO